LLDSSRRSPPSRGCGSSASGTAIFTSRPQA
jgi:hypothetical protein